MQASRTFLHLWSDLSVRIEERKWDTGNEVKREKGKKEKQKKHKDTAMKSTKDAGRQKAATTKQGRKDQTRTKKRGTSTLTLHGCATKEI